MLIQQINRTDPDKIFIIVRNTAATTATPGDWAQFNLDSADADNPGGDVKTPLASGFAALYHFAGIWARTVSRSDYGLCQVYGWSPKIRASGGAGTILPGKPMKPVTAKSYGVLATIGASTSEDASLVFVIAGTTTGLAQSVALTAQEGFIKALGM